MAQIAFSDLVKSLPRNVEPNFKSKKLPPGLTYVENSDPRFVEPRLTIQRPVQPGVTGAILIAAPGAVGKSTLAAQLAAQTGAVVWDLSRMNVGSKTFAGTVLEGWDTEAHGVLKRITDGRWLFVLDALDEAQVRAGSQNFEAFLADLAKLCDGPRDRPTIVLLARVETAGLVELVFEAGEVPLARYQVEYFDRAQTLSFIDKRLDYERSRDGKQALHRGQVKAFSEARDYLFKLVYSLFDVSADKAWDDPHVRDFLGYAPVLEAITEYVDVTNYKTLVEELKSEKGTAKDPWQFLTDIISRLQEREQRKIQEDFVHPVLEQMPAAKGWRGGAKLYQPNEQSARVLRYSLRLPAAPPNDIDLPSGLSNQYEDGLGSFLPQHPFLSGRGFTNVVFKEFVYAWGITRADEQTVSVLRKVMREREAPFLPSPLFSRFVVNSSTDAGNNTIIDGQDFGIVYESLLARSSRVEMSLFETGDAIEARVLLGNDPSRPLEFKLMDMGLGVHFWWRLNNADIDIARAVRLGLPEQRFALGPAVNVTCGEFSVHCDDLDVDSSGNVWIRSESNTSTGNLRIRMRDANVGRLAVTWPNVGHPWAAYRVPEGLAPAVLAETPRGETLRKFVLMFRRQRTRKADTVKNARWSPDQLGQRDTLLKLALDRGVLRAAKQDSLEFDSSFDSLKTLVDEQPQLTAGTRAFVAAYLGEEITARLLTTR